MFLKDSINLSWCHKVTFTALLIQSIFDCFCLYWQYDLCQGAGWTWELQGLGMWIMCGNVKSEVSFPILGPWAERTSWTPVVCWGPVTSSGQWVVCSDRCYFQARARPCRAFFSSVTRVATLWCHQLGFWNKKSWSRSPWWPLLDHELCARNKLLWL